jgi:hypothetical protein
VLCVDEKSQIQALDRTAPSLPSLPMLPTTPARRTHDYVRNGTTSLFAALDVTSGKVISATHRRHRHQEFLKFLRTINRNVPASRRCSRSSRPPRRRPAVRLAACGGDDRRPNRGRLGRSHHRRGLVGWIGSEAAADPTPGGSCADPPQRREVVSRFVELAPRNGDRLGRRLEDAPERAPESTAVEIDSSSRVGATTVRLVHHSLPPRPWPTISGDGAICWRRSVASCRRDWARQAWGWVMFTIQGMPNRSTHMPNSSPHICLSRGIVTVPPSDSFCQ